MSVSNTGHPQMNLFQVLKDFKSIPINLPFGKNYNIYSRNLKQTEFKHVEKM